MSLHDNLFAEDAEEDVRHFVESGEQRRRVLIFPPVNNYRRFLIHQLVQDRFGDLLQTFSIGQGFDRRTVVCYKSDFIRLPGQVNGTAVQGGNGVTRKSLHKMGIESQCTPTTSPEHGVQRSRQVKSAPAAEIYVPPALRSKFEKSPSRSTSAEPMSTPETPAKTSRQKRPDRAVYVPRHRRGAAEPEPSNASTPEPQSKSLKEQPRVSKRPIERVPLARRSHEPVPALVAEKTESQTMPLEKTESQTMPLEKTEQEVLEVGPVPVQQANNTGAKTELSVSRVPQSLMDEMESELASIASELISCDNLDNGMIVKNASLLVLQDEKMEVETSPVVTQVEVVDTVDEEETFTEKDIIKMAPPQYKVDTRDRNKSEGSQSDASSNVQTFSTDLPTVSELKKTEIVSETVKPESSVTEVETEPFNDSTKNKVITKPLVSKVLVISTNDTNDKPQESQKKEEEKSILPPISPPEKKVKKVERPKSKPAPPPTPPIKINRDECDWDSLFDDNGDCLDPTLIEELTSSVGEVVIEKPKSSYKSFTRPTEVSSDEFAHVLEIYNFPSEFKTSDLATVFSPFKTEGFELKWVDDTHCLAVFSSPLIAAEVLASDHPFVKTRPLSEATALSKTKARKSSEFLQPFRTRPETCAALARRLVTKSLGVKLATAKQEREQEKIVLREAKEKKRLAKKQSEEIWEGIISPKPTS